MPQFHLNIGSFEDGRTFAALPALVQGYIEAMFFTAPNGDCEEDSEDLTEAAFAELAPETLEGIIADCDSFSKLCGNLLDRAYSTPDVTYDEGRAGNDFWFTRNHHGAGFWDRDLGTVGAELTDIAHTFGEIDLYRGDDGLLYLL